MAELKREYVIPLRKKTLKAPKWRRSKKAISVVREFLQKHMKTEKIVICNELNEMIWERGIKNPPSKVNVIAVKKKINEKEMCIVNLKDKGVDAQLKTYEKEEIKEEKPKKEKENEKKVTKEKIDTKPESEPKKETKKKSEDSEPKNKKVEKEKVKKEVKENE